MQSRFWYHAVAAAAITLSSTAVFAQTKESTPKAEADQPAVQATGSTAGKAPDVGPAAKATPTPVAATATAPKTGTDQATLQADHLLRDALSRDESLLTRGYGTGHMEYVDMNGHYSMVTILTRHTDGTKTTVCVDNYESARKALDVPTAPSAPLQ